MSILLETRIIGSRRNRYLQELFGNSAHVPIAIILLELLLEGPTEYFRNPDLYALIFAALIQAYWLTRWQETTNPLRFWGNLIGPALYTMVEVSIEGMVFFAGGHHLAYWYFSTIIGLLQSIRTHLPRAPKIITSLLEGMVRSGILLVMYFIFEIATASEQPYTVAVFFTDSSHIFVTIAIVLLGASGGLAGATTEHYLELLRRTSSQLKVYSEWLLGSELLERLIENPRALTMKKRERTVLFMDIRGFTNWSEVQTPEEVAEMLNQYYQTAEMILGQHTVKMKYSADEVMAVFSTPIENVISVTFELRESINQLLVEHQLGAGIGVHTGLVVEGLLGSQAVKFYDAIGDTVNTSKRIESEAEGTEILISEAVRDQLGDKTSVGPTRQIKVKGKEKALIVFSLQNQKNGYR